MHKTLSIIKGHNSNEMIKETLLGAKHKWWVTNTFIHCKEVGDGR
jgi:hypothetical protein